MKICIVSLNITPYYETSPTSNYGGAEVQTAFIAEALAGQGHDVELVVSNLRDPSTIPHVAHNAFDSGDGVPGARFFHPRLSGILRALAKADADVYFQRNTGMVTGVTALFCRSKGRVFVYSAGSNTDFSPREIRVDGIRDKSLYQLGLKLAAGVIVQNDMQRDACRAQMDKPVCVIPNGVWSPEPGPADAERRVTWVGSLRPIKRPQLFVELARRMPDVGFTLVGGDTEAEADYAAEVVEEARGVSNIELTGRLSHTKVQEHVRRASILVNTSSVEGFPNVYLEAWNNGVPVVSFVDVDDLIATRGLGTICEDIDSVEKAVRELLGDSAVRAEMGERARALVADRYSAQALGPVYTGFFEKLLSARR